MINHRIEQQQSRQRSHRIISILVFFGLVTAATMTLSVGRLRLSAVNASEVNQSTQRVVVDVGGMQCSKCVAGIKAMLKRTPGVVAVEVSLEKKEAAVDYDTGKTTPEKIVEAINNLGYRAKVKDKT